MELESGLLNLAENLAQLSHQRDVQWRDAAGQQFESRQLRPLIDVVEQFRQAAADYAAAVDEGLARLNH